MPVRVEFGRDFGAVEVGPGTSLLAAAGRARAPLGNACRGAGVCRACAVEVLAGAELLTDANELERAMALPRGWRMACQTRVGAADGVLRLWTPHWGPDRGDPSAGLGDPG